jgi:NTP pyrophosphatase (non-canonical NTP hydrolase)
MGTNYTGLGLNEYQIEAMSFRLPSASPEYAVLGLSAEVGELHSLISKAMRDGRKMDYDQNVKKELGDILWNVAAVALDHGYTLEDIAAGNIVKLSGRKDNNTIQGSGDNR